MTILDKIVAYKIAQVAEQQKTIPLTKLIASPNYQRTCLNFATAIQNGSGIIAEFKRKSPSKGTINADADVETVLKQYQDAGASAVSILTDTPFFGGTQNDVLRARTILTIPILRKDFIVDDYQIHEAKAIGADVILLIASCLTPNQCIHLAQTAKSIGLNIFLEIHTENELQYFNEFIDVVGINNRNLKTFEVDIQNSIKLSKSLPQNAVKVAESGIKLPETVKLFKQEGFEGFLIGENFMKTLNPGKACNDFIKAIQS